MYRSWSIHGAGAWHHRIGDNSSVSVLKFFDGSAAYPALILIFFVLELP
jgi:hypothetical protein